MNPETFDAFATAAMDCLHAFAKHCQSGQHVDTGLVLALNDLADAYCRALGGKLTIATRIVCDPRVVKIYATHSLWHAMQALLESRDTDHAQRTFYHHFAPCLKLPNG